MVKMNTDGLCYVRAQPHLTRIETAANVTRTQLTTRQFNHAATAMPGATLTARSRQATSFLQLRPVRASALRCAVLLTLFLSACTMQTTSSFDSASWKSQRGADAQQNRRGTMVAALEKSIDVGMPREQVIALLGEPDSTDAATSTDMYELGVAQYGVDEEFYQIQYQDGKVATHRWGRR